MRAKVLFLSLALLCNTSGVMALEHSHEGPSMQEIQQFLTSVFNDNAEYVENIEHAHLSNYTEQQDPRATVVSCSDSRVQSDAFHKNPVNDLFFIRNIGNQIKSTEGSVEYGVEHLHTPVLLIIGHSQCGAIKTALGDYSSLSIAIRQELNNLHLSKSEDVDDGVVENVHDQVKYAMDKFKTLINDKKLVVIGAIYDFRDDFKHGHGRLILIDINGEKDPKKLKDSDYIKGIKDMAVGENR